MRGAARLGATAALLGAALGHPPLVAQSRLRVGIDAKAGFVWAVASTRASYGRGLSGGGSLSFGWSESPWRLRIEGTYARLDGGNSSLGFPALNLLGFGLTGVRRVGSPAGVIAPFLFAGLGPWNVQDALPFAAWRTGLGSWGGLGIEAGRGRLKAVLEGRLQRVTGHPGVSFVRLDAGARWAP